MAEANSNDFQVICCTCLVLLSILVSLYLMKKVLPDQLKKLHKKITAWLLSKIMWRLHLKCAQQKIDLFKNFQDLKCCGRVPHILEVGVGSGNNMAFLPKQCTLSCLDPNLEHQQYVTHMLQQYPGIKVDKFAGGFAEDMGEFAGNIFDAVVLTFTMCSVWHPDKAISEIKRVLKPGGSFFFMEHVAARKPTALRTMQEWLEVIWPSVADGCHLTRETWTLVEEAGFTTVQQQHFTIQGVTPFPFLKFGLYGVAVK